MEKMNKKTTAIVQVIITFIAAVYLLPTLFVLFYALKSRQETAQSFPLALPKSIEWGNFTRAFETLNFWQTFGNTLWITACSVVLIILISSMAAYSIARGATRIFNSAYVFFIAGILIPYQVIFVPMFILGRNLGFVNNYWGVIFLYVATNLPMAIFIATGFMKNIPKEIEEAAAIDGASIYKTYWVIVLPMLKPVSAALAIILSLQIWNDYLLPLLFLQDNSMKTLTVMQAQLFSAFSTDFNTGFAGIILSSLPILILFLFMQRHFVKGISMGAGK
ncbi:carbohydrate ABC transporter permease [Domibacillus sp. DTU_2020_1001157_1_SI_ALB_TIR_016]|uniref:carbohydrate ABC transporter permease n=1 Tax=Domibacillus sp. DTU_2020_1001157_1_SI_ALB_TIR_016 TaxID=3077789 RepID=UPI0028EC13C5|nr:carbohydrate ABC transporter permease [Domibacillus sp. DTU_2020_1001157_1_SI_ALB_TIR_016]WNS78765.1 carbohydrate ABC transporter permease [Domibacillus sp. DTU_2020_1001157_1_SI_ALB_TIR_016]